MDQERWQRLSEAALVVAALGYLVAYSVQVLARTEPPVSTALSLVVGAVWAVFVVDYLVRLALAPHRARWFTRHLFDLLIVVLPFLRPLQLLQLVKSATVLTRSHAMARAGRRAAVYALGTSVLVVYVGALAVFAAERDAPGGDIRSFGDAVWWAITTVTTVGYGDYAPVTVQGRVIATGVMLVGIALLGSVTAALAGTVLQTASSDPAPAAPPATGSRESALEQEVEALRGQVARLIAAPPA